MSIDNIMIRFVVAVTTIVCCIQSSVALRMPFTSNRNSFPLAKRGEAEGGRLFFKGRPLPTDTYVTRHDDVVLECEVGGSPSPSIHWLKNGIRIQQGDSRDYLDDEAYLEDRENPSGQQMLRLGKMKSKLYLDCVSDRSEDEYTCVAETAYERITQSTYVKIVQDSLEVPKHCISKKAFRGEPARIYLWTAVRLEYEGASVQLFCRAQGFPAPKCSWRYSESDVTVQDDLGHQILPSGDLLLTNISWEDNMGAYYCSCENRQGVDEISTFLYPTEP